MAHDLILKDNTTNWARGSVVVPIGVLTKVESKKKTFSPTTSQNIVKNESSAKRISKSGLHRNASDEW
jgi:hypothetical protein